MKVTKAIILIGGSGERFGSDLPKQFHYLAGKRVYEHTVEKFLEVGFFDEVIVVCAKQWMEKIRGARVVEGGRTRQESSYLGLLACGEETDYVVIHDGVRPFVTERILRENITALERFVGVDTCIASADTIVHAKGEVIEGIPKREHYLRGQTPQSFHYNVIVKAHERAVGGNASDDCQLVLAMGEEVGIVRGEESNIKITNQLDLFLAGQIVRKGFEKKRGEGRSLKGKRFVVVGGTGGIGSEVCALLDDVIIVSRKDIDIGDAQSVERFFGEIGEVDGVINCAGVLERGKVADISYEQIEEMVRTNLLGVINVCKAARVRSGGHIINVASSSYTYGRKEYAAYCAAKAGVVNFTQGFAQEREDLCVNALAPSRTLTKMRKDNFSDEECKEALHPREVAEEIITILKQDSLTGEIIEVKRMRHDGLEPSTLSLKVRCSTN